ncbi:MAG: YeeE/YedE family protein [Clostridiales bacterium]|nr:YeeE/YedE family protein [Clostridiales bacterium]
MKASRWSWIKGGVILGVLNTLVYFQGQRLGTSDTYVKTVIKMTEYISPNLALSTFLTHSCGCDTRPVDPAILMSTYLHVDWQMMVVLGIFIGTFIARRRTGGGAGPAIPDTWKARFGNRYWLRYMQGFIGGVLLLLGTRLAGGCTSGHVISGTSRLAVSGLTFGLAAFATGIPTALLIFRQRRNH